MSGDPDDVSLMGNCILTIFYDILVQCKPFTVYLYIQETNKCNIEKCHSLDVPVIKPVYKDQPKDNKCVVVIAKWSLYTG